MRAAFVVYPDFTALDLVGPYEVISRGPGAESISCRAAPIRSGATVA
jgi:hypothetical protein